MRIELDRPVKTIAGRRPRVGPRWVLAGQRRSSAAASAPAILRRTAARSDHALGPGRLSLIGFSVLLEGAVLWAVHGAIVDDGYISLDYARTLAFHGDWGALPAVPSNTATSPLNVMALAAVTAVVRSPMAAMWALALANAAALGVGLLRLGDSWRVGGRLAWVATPLLILDPVIASSTGLETAMTVTALVWLLDAGARGGWRRFGWLTGLSVVLRPDLILVAAVVWLLHPGLRGPSPVSAIAGTAWRTALLGLPWYVFSWLYFGSAIPDTLVMKTHQNWGHFSRGLWSRYYDNFPWAVASVTVAGAIGLVILAALPVLRRTALRRTAFSPTAWSVASCGLAGLAYYGAYMRLHVPPYFWYYAIPLASLTIVAAFGVCVLMEQSGGAPRPAALAGRALGGAAVAAMLVPALIAWGSGLARHTPLREAPIHGNWALPGQYRQIGEDLARRLPPGAVVRSAGEFGTILYYCHCDLVDRFDQRSLIIAELLQAADGSWPMRLNYHWLDPSRYPEVREDFHLTYRPGRSPLGDGWNVWSPERRAGHYSLERGPNPLDAAEGLVP
jgi:hypothetical protein